MSIQKNTSKEGISKIQYRRKQELTVEELTNGILNGDKTALARGITLVESTHQKHLQKVGYVIEKCLTKASNSIRVGITGVPGVGKSTFIETLGKHLTSLGKKVAVLAIDPTSSQSRGSILGDKTRMHELVKDSSAFIRPSPSSESLGGVARKTRETMILCEAAGYDVILIETVGVGQSETAVHSMVDFFLLLKLAGAGDELQGIKRGIIEMADVLVINKADGNNRKAAQAAKVEFTRALQLYPPKANEWSPKVLTCSALEGTGVSKIWELIIEYIEHSKKSGFFDSNRKNQNKSWLLQHIDNQIKIDFYQHKSIAPVLPTVIQEVTNGEISPFKAAEKLMERYHKNT